MKASHVFLTGAKVVGYKLCRRFGSPLPMPVNMAIYVTQKCNSRCKTCNVWRNPVREEMSVDEWEGVFKSIGKTHAFVTVSGGEPFLSEDLVDIIRSLVKHIEPCVIVFPTNGILTEKIEHDIKEILEFYKEKMIINFSLDGVGKLHDEIRGVKGNFNKLLNSISAMNALKGDFKNLWIGVNTVISKHNINSIKDVADFVKGEINHDAHLFEIADNRAALHNVNMNLKPGIQSYTDMLDMVSIIGRLSLVHFFRNRYYKLVREVLENGSEIIPCYAGISSVEISSTGSVWNCCRMCESMGNLRDNDYDFKKVWKSERAKKVRRDIKERRCWCTSTNANYTNILCNFRRIVGI